MEELLSAFDLNRKTRNQLKNIIVHLGRNGKTADDFVEYAEAINRAEREQIHRFEREARKLKGLKPYPCPECQDLMFLRTVNDSPGNQTGDDSKTVWLCPNKDCMNTIYSTKTTQEWFNELQ